MELVYEKYQYHSILTYGETFASWIKTIDYQDRHVFILTNQRYYDLFADKIVQLFYQSNRLDWYICKNNPNCNNFIELESTLSFLSEFSKNETFLFLGLGNEGVIQLTCFIQQTFPVESECWLLPLSIRAFSQALQNEVSIEHNNKIISK